MQSKVSTFLVSKIGTKFLGKILEKESIFRCNAEFSDYDLNLKDPNTTPLKSSIIDIFNLFFLHLFLDQIIIKLKGVLCVLNVNK